MGRERILKVVLVLVGLLFCAGLYPLLLMVKQDPALAMMMSLYVTLGVFLLLASRNPSAHRSLIAFAGWSSFAHAGVMSIQALKLFGWARTSWRQGRSSDCHRPAGARVLSAGGSQLFL